MKKIITFLLLSTFLLNPTNVEKIEAQAEGEVGITATVGGCGIVILIKPEKRWPKEGNFSNKNQIIFYDQLYQEIFRFEDIETDKDGYATIDVCSGGFTTEPGVYSIYVKGYSHVGRFYIEKEGFFKYTTFFNLAKNQDEYLLAGDTLVNDYVNALDLNESISKLYSNDIRSDLNRDGIVNSLDLSNQIYNLHRGGQLKL